MKKTLNQTNQLVGSSETIRKTPEFYTVDCALHDKKVYTQTFDWSGVSRCLPQHKKKYSPEFLSWFVGFTEGDGSFVVSGNRQFFIITQKDTAFLHRLRTELGFGTICNDKKNPEIKRFIVTNPKHLLVLILIFNGNLLLKKTTSRFAIWLQEWNRLTGDNISLQTRWLDTNVTEKLPGTNSRDRISETQLLSLRTESQVWNTSWLAGFLEAEGCFAVGIENKTNPWFINQDKPVLRFMLDQTGELEILTHVRLLLGDFGTIWIRKKTTEIEILDSFFIQKKNGIKIEKVHDRFETKHLGGLEQIIKYIARSPLRTKKNVVFVQWKKLLNKLFVVREERLNKKLISAPKRKEKVDRLIRAIREWKSIRE